jgi:hypothetical protein
VTLLIVIAGACVLSLIVSRVITWAAGKSPFWNMGFAVVVVLNPMVGFAIALITLLFRLS